MRKFISALCFSVSMLSVPAAFAAERTITFAVDNMTCASCPFIVKASMASVAGVENVAVSFEAKTATVTFDDGKTTAETIAAASTDAGYPAHPQLQGS